MHFIGSDLNFKRFAVVTYYCSMKRLIHIRFRHGNIVLKPSGNRFPHCMNYSQNSIAVLYIVNYDSHSDKVKYFINLLMLHFHFFVNAVIVLCTSVNIIMEVHTVQSILYLGNYIIYCLFTLFLAFVYFLLQLLEFFRMKIL